MEENLDQQASLDSVQGTPIVDETTQTSSQIDAGNDEQTQDVETLPEGDSDNQEKVDTTQRNEEAERKKYAKLESENARTIRAMREFEETLKTDPEAWEKFRMGHKNRTGMDLGDYASRFGQVQQPNQQVSQQAQPQQQGLSLEDLEERVESRLEQKRVLKEFTSEFTEFAPNPSDDEDSIQEKSRKFNTINKWAHDLMAEDPKLSYKEALTEAYYSRPENRSKALQKAESLATDAGRATAYAQGAGTSGGVSGANSKVNNKKELTPEDREVMKTLKLSEDEYLNQKYGN